MIYEGPVIKASLWEEPVKVHKIEEISGVDVKYFRIVGVTLNSKRHIDQLLTENQLRDVQILAEGFDISADPHEVFLNLEALRFKYASLFDPLLAMDVSKIDPLPFQIEAVCGYILKQPRIRFLIADDPGAGKTIFCLN